MLSPAEYVIRQVFHLWYGSLSPISKEWIWCVVVINPYQELESSLTAALTACPWGSGDFLTMAVHWRFTSCFCLHLCFLLKLGSGFWPDVKLKSYSLLNLSQPSSKRVDQEWWCLSALWNSFGRIQPWVDLFQENFSKMADWSQKSRIKVIF